DLPEEPSHIARISLYRCAQESISNVIRHSGATRLEVYFRSKGPGAELIIADNGKGISQAAARGTGLGLTAIREHAAAGGGTCNIKTGNNGTSITILIPVTSEQ